MPVFIRYRPVYPLWLISFFFLCHCGRHYEPFENPISIDYYIINRRLETILVKNRDGTNGIVGFFLDSGQVYHFAYHDKIWIPISHDRPEPSDLQDFKFIFDFYSPGEDGNFQEWIGDYTFVPDLQGSLSYIDTCFVD